MRLRAMNTPKRKRVSVTEGDVTRHHGVSASMWCALGADAHVGEIFKG